MFHKNIVDSFMAAGARNSRQSSQAHIVDVRMSSMLHQ